MSPERRGKTRASPCRQMHTRRGRPPVSIDYTLCTILYLVPGTIIRHIVYHSTRMITHPHGQFLRVFSSNPRGVHSSTIDESGRSVEISRRDLLVDGSLDVSAPLGCRRNHFQIRPTGRVVLQLALYGIYPHQQMALTGGAMCPFCGV